MRIGDGTFALRKILLNKMCIVRCKKYQASFIYASISYNIPNKNFVSTIKNIIWSETNQTHLHLYKHPIIYNDVQLSTRSTTCNIPHIFTITLQKKSCFLNESIWTFLTSINTKINLHSTSNYGHSQSTPINRANYRLWQSIDGPTDRHCVTSDQHPEWDRLWSSWFLCFRFLVILRCILMVSEHSYYHPVSFAFRRVCKEGEILEGMLSLCCHRNMVRRVICFLHV